MNKQLKNYIRESFPEYSELTVLEIYCLNYSDKNFITNISNFYDGLCNDNSIIINDLIFIDLADFFEKNKEKYTHDFICDYCFKSNVYLKEDKGLLVKIRLNIDLYKSSYIFFSQNIKNNNYEINFKGQCLEYNQSNIYYIISNYISHIKQKKLRSGTMFSSLVGYIENETDLCHFFNVYLFSENALQINEHGVEYDIDDDKIIIIEYKHHNIQISNQKSHIFYKADLRKISKKDFFYNIIRLLKSILIDINKKSKIDFYSSWKDAIYEEIEYMLPIGGMNDLKIKVYKPEPKCNFLNKTIYSQRPLIEISFVFNNDVIWYLKMNNATFFYKKDIIEGYQYYKTLSSITHDKIEVHNSMNIVESNSQKRRL